MSTSIFITILIAIIPTVAMMVFIYFQDTFEKEPIGLLLKIFGLGCLSVLPILLVEMILDFIIKLIFGGTTLIFYAVDAFLGVAMVEEFFKFLAAYLLTWRNKEFNYKFDGIVYCLFGSMGFAAMENIEYLVLGTDSMFSSVLTLGIQRGLLAIPCHAMCAIFMGYFYGQAKYLKSYGDRSGCHKSLITGFIIATCLHGFYDFCLFTNMGIFYIIFFIFVIVADVFTIIRIIKAKKENTKMYQAPQYRQYWANPYQPYGGYTAPQYGGYSYNNANIPGAPQPVPIASNPGYNPGTPQQGYSPVGQSQGYTPAPVRNESHAAPAYNPNAVSHGQAPSGVNYNPGTTQQGYNPGTAQQGYNPGTAQQGYNPGTTQQGYNPGASQQGYNPNASQSGQRPNNGRPIMWGSQAIRQQMIYCPVCSAINNFNAFNCNQCGASLHQLRNQ